MSGEFRALTCDGRPGHQIVAVFSARLADTSLHARNEITFVDNGVAGTARWVTRATFRSEQHPHGPPLYPDGLASLLDRVPAKVSSAKKSAS